jgi:hypothetical protein
MLDFGVSIRFCEEGTRVCCRSASQLQYRESIHFVAVHGASVHPRQLCRGIGGCSGGICADETIAQGSCLVAGLVEWLRVLLYGEESLLAD